MGRVPWSILIRPDYTGFNNRQLKYHFEPPFTSIDGYKTSYIQEETNSQLYPDKKHNVYYKTNLFTNTKNATTKLQSIYMKIKNPFI